MREKNVNPLSPILALTWDRTSNLFGIPHYAPTNYAIQPGLFSFFKWRFQKLFLVKVKASLDYSRNSVFLITL